MRGVYIPLGGEEAEAGVFHPKNGRTLHALWMSPFQEDQMPVLQLPVGKTSLDCRAYGGRGGEH